jgi:hypothetical protein
MEIMSSFSRAMLRVSVLFFSLFGLGCCFLHWIWETAVCISFAMGTNGEYEFYGGFLWSQEVIKVQDDRWRASS